MPEQPTGTLEHVDDECYVIVKAAPRASKTHGETVCIAAIDRGGSWVRLYPVSFRDLADAQRFGRWDHLKFRWRRPRAASDMRPESRRVDASSIVITGQLPVGQRNQLLNRIAVTSLHKERAANKSLALLRPEIIDFRAMRRSSEEIEEQRSTYAAIEAQTGLFEALGKIIPRDPCPYKFVYRFRDDDGPHTGTCQDWETEATYFRRLKELGSEKAALGWMQQKFGEEYPALGMALAMGTHRHRPDQWLINGVVRMTASTQGQLI
ncbi:MAG: hypothetical protein JWR80_2053 [Bradyrhizobium sp.]|nr:hypothetical protein [Bradyrhizobium sp.]